MSILERVALSESEVDWGFDGERLLFFLFGLGITAFSLYVLTQLGWGWSWWFFSFAVFGLVLMLGAAFYLTDAYKALDAPSLKKKHLVSYLAAVIGGMTIGYLLFDPSGEALVVTWIGVLVVEVVWALYIFFFVEEYHIY